MIIKLMRRICFTLATCVTAGILSQASAKSPEEWRFVPLEGPIDIELGRETRTIEPSCSGAPVGIAADLSLDVPQIITANTDYGIYVQQGDPRRILVHLDGPVAGGPGGLCATPETCIGAALAGMPLFTAEIDIDAFSPANRDGVFSNSKENPFRKWTKVVIPYCTGDVHIGSVDQTYTLPAGPLPFDVTATVRHRGFDNVLGALHWLKTRGPEELGFRPFLTRGLAISGESAGSLGGTFALPYFTQTTPFARVSFIGDGNVGVSDVGFYAVALLDTEAGGFQQWNIQPNLPKFVPGFDEDFVRRFAADPDGFTPAILGLLARWRYGLNFSQIITDRDAVRTFFLALLTGRAPQEVECEAFNRARANIAEAEAMIPYRYRFFIEASNTHTTLGDQLFFEERASGEAVADFVDRQVRFQYPLWRDVDAGRPCIE